LIFSFLLSFLKKIFAATTARFEPFSGTLGLLQATDVLSTPNSIESVS